MVRKPRTPEERVAIARNNIDNPKTFDYDQNHPLEKQLYVLDSNVLFLEKKATQARRKKSWSLRIQEAVAALLISTLCIVTLQTIPVPVNPETSSSSSTYTSITELESNSDSEVIQSHLESQLELERGSLAEPVTIQITDEDREALLHDD